MGIEWACGDFHAKGMNLLANLNSRPLDVYAIKHISRAHQPDYATGPIFVYRGLFFFYKTCGFSTKLE